MEKKISTPDVQKKQEQEAADKAAKAGKISRLVVQLKQKAGIAEWTKLEPRFERNIDKLISYHDIVFHIVDALELQLQITPETLAKREVADPPKQNPWEMLGGWLNWLSQNQFTGQQTEILAKYSKTCGNIAKRERKVQQLTRTKLIRKMRMYTGDESEELNNSYTKLKHLLLGVDESRHHLKSAQTTKEVRARGDAYYAMIRAFNETGNEIQGWIDEVSIVAVHHEHELIEFSKQLSELHGHTFNYLLETIVRLAEINTAMKKKEED